MHTHVHQAGKYRAVSVPLGRFHAFNDNSIKLHKILQLRTKSIKKRTDVDDGITVPFFLLPGAA